MGDNGLQSIISYIFSRLNPTPPNDDNMVGARFVTEFYNVESDKTVKGCLHSPC